jgi:hypothetical protein
MIETGENKISKADGEYEHAVFDALMNFQAIEELLKDCILVSYQILSKTTPEGVEFHPSKKDIKDIKSRLGLGGLISRFEMVTPYKDICVKLRAATKTRNELAHTAAANYLKFPVSSSGADQILAKASDFNDAAVSANSLFYELSEVFEKIMEVHGKTV